MKMLQMTFGIDERDVRAVLEKHWDMIVNPQHRSVRQLTLAIWHSMGEEDRDRFATAVMEAYLDSRDEVESGHDELCKYLVEQGFMTRAPSRASADTELELLHIRGRRPERRHLVRHR